MSHITTVASTSSVTQVSSFARAAATVCGRFHSLGSRSLLCLSIVSCMCTSNSQACTFVYTFSIERNFMWIGTPNLDSLVLLVIKNGI